MSRHTSYKIRVILVTNLKDLVTRHDDCFRWSYEGAARNVVYTSPDIQNQLAMIMGNMVREVICSDVRDVDYYSLLVNESGIRSSEQCFVARF